MGVFTKNGFMLDVPPLGTVSLITKCRKYFWRKVLSSKPAKIKTLLQVDLYFVIRSMVSNRETHHILAGLTSIFL